MSFSIKGAGVGSLAKEMKREWSENLRLHPQL